MNERLSENDNPKSADPRSPEAVADHERLDRLRDDIFRLELERNIVELELYGYTIIRDAMPMPFFDELRAAIMALAEEDSKAGRLIPLAAPEGESYAVPWLLPRGRVFEQAVMAEKPLTLVTYMLGESCEISSNHGHVRVQGDPPQGLHIDCPFVPAPVPAFLHACTMMWCLDEFSLESGATFVVPGSHRRLVYPTPGDTSLKAAIPLTAAKGSVIVFNGNLWHGAGARTVPGERVGMTVYFNRMYALPEEDFSGAISDEVVARNPPRFAHLIGRNNPFPSRNFEPLAVAGGAIKTTRDPRG